MGVYLAGLLVIIGGLKLVDVLFCKEEKAAEQKEAEAAAAYKH